MRAVPEAVLTLRIMAFQMEAGDSVHIRTKKFEKRLGLTLRNDLVG